MLSPCRGLRLQLTAVPEGSSACPYELASKKRDAQAAAEEDAGLGSQVGADRPQTRRAGRQPALQSTEALAPGGSACIACSARWATRTRPHRFPQDWRWQQRGAKRQQRERAPIAAPSLGARVGDQAGSQQG